jgi:hypothetical protein
MFGHFMPLLLDVVNTMSRGSVASIVRMLYLHSITVPTGEFFVNISKLSVWSTIEPGVGITVASLATLRPLLAKVVERTRRASVPSQSSQLNPSNAHNTNMNPSSMTNHTRDDSVGMSSDTTIAPPGLHGLQGHTYKVSSKTSLRMSREESIQDIEAEMCAYGMSNFNSCATLDEENLDRYTPEARRERDNKRRMRWLQSQRAMRSPPPQESVLRTASHFKSVDQSLSPRQKDISNRVQGSRDDFVLDE